MSEKNQLEQLYTQKEVESLTKLSASTLEAWRTKGKGLPFIKLNKSIRYKQSDVERFCNGIEAQEATHDK